MARKKKEKREIISRQSITFYEGEEEIFNGICEMADKNKQNLRGAIVYAIEYYLKHATEPIIGHVQQVTPPPVQEMEIVEEKKQAEEFEVDPEVAKLFG